MILALDKALLMLQLCTPRDGCIPSIIRACVIFKSRRCGKTTLPSYLVRTQGSSYRNPSIRVSSYVPELLNSLVANTSRLNNLGAVSTCTAERLRGQRRELESWSRMSKDWDSTRNQTIAAVIRVRPSQQLSHSNPQTLELTVSPLVLHGPIVLSSSSSK